MSDELVVVVEKNIPALFEADGSNILLKRIREEVGKFEPDISTAKGRKDIASNAHKVSKCKVRFDDLGKDLGDGYKKKLDIINAERKKFRDELDTLKIEVRKPLTDWEDAEKKRAADIEDRINEINRYGEGACNYESSIRVKIDMASLREITVDESFEEFELAATKAKEASLTQLEAKFIVLQNQEKEAAEAERLENERLEKERIEREEKIAKEAAEKATREAEEKAKAESEEKDRLAKEKVEKAEKEALEAKLTAEKAEREKKEAAEKAEQDKKDAVKAEQDRIEEEKRNEEEATKKREENKQHRNKIIKAAVDDLTTHCDVDNQQAAAIVATIINNLIRHIKIEF